MDVDSLCTRSAARETKSCCGSKRIVRARSTQVNESTAPLFCDSLVRLCNRHAVCSVLGQIAVFARRCLFGPGDVARRAMAVAVSGGCRDAAIRRSAGIFPRGRGLLAGCLRMTVFCLRGSGRAAIGLKSWRATDRSRASIIFGGPLQTAIGRRQSAVRDVKLWDR